MDANDPWVIELPMSIKGSLDTFQKLLLLKTLREEKLIFLIKNYVKETLGPLFIESPVFDLKGSY
jgi:dynein heavy chain